MSREHWRLGQGHLAKLQLETGLSVFVFFPLHCDCLDKSLLGQHQDCGGPHLQSPSLCSTRNAGRAHLEWAEVVHEGWNSLPERALGGGPGDMGSHPGFATNSQEPGTSYCPLWPSPSSFCKEGANSYNRTFLPVWKFQSINKHQLH